MRNTREDSTAQSTTSTHHVVTLGTAGGPRYWPGGQRSGIATAVVVDDGFYLVDCGHGVGKQLERAGLPLQNLKGIFITHLHSDHVVDLNSLILFTPHLIRDPDAYRIPIYGPGNREQLPPQDDELLDRPVSEQCPTPGTVELFNRLVDAFATDLNDRIIDSHKLSPHILYQPIDIALPSDCGFNPDHNPTPEMIPFVIHRDNSVTVTATLVAHPPMAPAFAFRFETDRGAVAISGDTGVTNNMVQLSQDAGLVLHEALDFEFMEARYRGLKDATSMASMAHHRKAHSSVEDAVGVASRAGAARLALHHLVPGNANHDVWFRGSESFAGEFLVPDDLDRISFERQYPPGDY